MTLDLFPTTERWRLADRYDQRVRRLADRHYSRQTVGAAGFAPPGKILALVDVDATAAWVVVENLDPVGNLRWRCTLFRNESPALSSDLVREATTRTFAWWRHHYRGVPAVPLRTEVDPSKTRQKRNPGWCFIKAGWSVVGEVRGLVVLEAPRE